MNGKMNILIVDDEVDLRVIYRYFLEDDGYNVLEADDGESALKIIIEKKVDFIISDIRMPRGDGIYLLKELQNLSSKAPPIVMMTGFSDYKRKEILELGALEIFQKPVNFEEVLKTMQSHLNKCPIE